MFDKDKLFEESFCKPIYPEKQIIARAKKLIPHYAAWNQEKEAFFCTACDQKVPRGEITLNKHGVCPSCGSTVQFVKDRWIGDALWIFIPDDKRASYWHVNQCVNKNGEYSLTVREEARYTISPCRKRTATGYSCYYNPEFHTDSDTEKVTYWVRCYNEEAWSSRKNPHFVRNNMYLERQDWCDRNYVVPSQYQAYLERLAPEIRTFGFNEKNPLADDTQDVWVCTMVGFDKVVAKMGDERKTVIRILNEYNCGDVPDNLFFASSDYWEEMTTKKKTNVKINTQGKTPQEILCLSDLQYEEYMASDKSFNTLKQIASSESIPVPKSLRANPDFHTECWMAAERLMDKCGLDLDKTFVCPTTSKGKYIYLRYTAENVKGCMRLKEQVLIPTDKGNLLKGKKMLLKPNFEIGTPETLVDVFNKLVPLTVVPQQGRKHFVGNNVMRTALIEQPSNAFIWEKLKYAGYVTLAKEFAAKIQRHSKIEWHTLDDGSGALNSILGVPPRFMDGINKNDATIHDIQHMQAAYRAVPTITLDDYLLYSIMYPHDKLGEWILDNNQTIHETIRYFSRMHNRSHVMLGEYQQYIENLHILHKGETISKKQAFPADFEKAQKKVDELIRTEKDKDLTDAMQKISKALRSDKTITRFLKRNTKYVVMVPESPEELRREGERLSNCLATYATKVAEGSTSIFFIRRADDPKSAFVAMEYNNGRIVQIHKKMNKDAGIEVKKFADSFVTVLNKVNYDPHTAIQAAA